MRAPGASSPGASARGASSPGASSPGAFPAGASSPLRTLLEPELTTIPQVAVLLEGVEAHCLLRRDRRGVFATAYLGITRAVEGEIQAGAFHDAAWATRYLVAFGNLYRRALLAWESGDHAAVPKAWRIAFQCAGEGWGLVIQHLLLGINAHINHDLAVALAQVGIDPDRPLRYADHTHINAVLEGATEQLKAGVSAKYAPILERVDWIAGRLDDDLTRFSIPKARDHAWSCAVALAAARGETERSILLRALDEQAGVLAGAILAPPTRHPVLLRTVRSAERADAAVRRVGSAFRGIFGGGRWPVRSDRGAPDPS